MEAMVNNLVTSPVITGLDTILLTIGFIYIYTYKMYNNNKKLMDTMSSTHVDVPPRPSLQ